MTAMNSSCHRLQTVTPKMTTQIHVFANPLDKTCLFGNAHKLSTNEKTALQHIVLRELIKVSFTFWLVERQCFEEKLLLFP